MIRKIPIIFCIFFAIFFLTSDKRVSIYSAQKFPQKLLRIRVIKDAPQISLTIKGSYKIFALHTNQLLFEAKNLRKTQVLPLMSGIKLSDEDFKIYGLKIVPKRDSNIYVDKRRFRGNIDIIRTEDMKLLVINHIDVEDYLRGVLYNEVSHWWPMATLKAQAITARTYALYQSQVNKAKDYDMTSDVYSQVYGGRFSERWRTDRAIRATKNKVLTYKGSIFSTYYHATCGGHTENASNLWNVDLSPLEGSKCTFCRRSPHYDWKKEMSLLDIESKLKSSGFKIGNIKSIEVIRVNKSGRAEEIEVKSASATLTIPAKDFRRILGNNFIRSTHFKLKIRRNKVSFDGRGWGHGVGMCQWGAYLMGKRRYKSQEILAFYYPGTKIEEYRP